MKIRKSKGAKTVPCGTPKRTLHELLRLLFNITDCKENLLSRLKEGLNTIKLASLLKRQEWGTLSKALQNLIATHHIALFGLGIAQNSEQL